MMTLQELCIEVIVGNFERFFLAFSKTDDAHLKMKFEFLQRVYSHQIASQLYVLDKMKPNYIDLLVNKYLKVLDTEWFKGVPWETVVAKFAEVGSSIQKISFHECSEETPWQTIIHHLINLEVMNCPFDCNDEILNCIAKFCPNIVEIDVTSCLDVTNKGIKYLCMEENGTPLCPKLKKLWIADSGVNEDGFKYLIKNLRFLEETDCHDLPQVLYLLHQNDLSALDKIEPYNFTNLDFSHLYSEPYYTDLIKVCLTLCPRIKSLSCSVLMEDHLNLISSHSVLEKLHLKCFSSLNSELDITNFLKLKGRNLASLWVSSCSLSVPTLAECCPRLKQLNLNRVILKNDDSASPLFHHLEKCTFEDCTFEFTNVKSMCSILESSPILKHLAFKLCHLSHNDLNTALLKCSENSPLREVIFSASSVDIYIAKDLLMNCHSLKLLKFYRCLFDIYEREELLNLAKIIPNNPEIDFEDDLSVSEWSDAEDDSMHSYDAFDGREYDFDDYDHYDFNDYDHYVFDDYDEDEDDYYY